MFIGAFVPGIRHLKSLKAALGASCPEAYLVPRCPHKLELEEGIYAIPWSMLGGALNLSQV